MNKVVLVGRLTKDPDIYYSSGPTATCIARYTLAVNRRYKNQDGNVEADFIPCVTFGKNGEFAEKYLKKGLRISISGRIQTGSYEKDGRKVYTTEVVAEEQEFCDSKAASNGGAAAGGSNGSTTSAGSMTAAGSMAATPAAGDDDFMDIPDGIQEELPFA